MIDKAFKLLRKETKRKLYPHSYGIGSARAEILPVVDTMYVVSLNAPDRESEDAAIRKITDIADRAGVQVAFCSAAFNDQRSEYAVSVLKPHGFSISRYNIILRPHARS